MDRRVLIQAGLGGIAGLGFQPVPQAESSLAQQGTRAGLIFGAAFDLPTLTDPMYRNLYLEEVSIVTTDYHMKFKPLRPAEDRVDWTICDKLVDFAVENRKLLRGTCLIWNEAMPSWMSALTSDRVEYWLDRHIDEVMTRYSGKVFTWDVVNEPFWPGHKNPGDYRGGVFYRAMGSRYIERSIKRAKNLAGSAKIAINEAGLEYCDEAGRRMQADMLNLIYELKQSGAELDVVGIESHLIPDRPFSPVCFEDFVGKLAEKGVDVHLTELDVKDFAFPDDVRQRDEMVARCYSEFLNSALKCSSVKVVICWELSNKYTWYNDVWKQRYARPQRSPRPLPYDENFVRTECWHSLSDAFARRRLAAGERHV